MKKVEKKAAKQVHEAKKAAIEAIKNDGERPAPFAEGSAPSSMYTQVQYQRVLDQWFEQLQREQAQPNNRTSYRKSPY